MRFSDNHRTPMRDRGESGLREAVTTRHKDRIVSQSIDLEIIV